MDKVLENDESSRRIFLQTTTAALSTLREPIEEEQTAGPGFALTTLPRKLSDHLYILEDTCNVYLIQQGDRGLLIDFGSGHILSFLPQLGISHLDWILHTHHHRDQAQGDGLAVARNIPIAVPQHERQFFQDAENFWRNRRVVELYDVKNDFFSLTKDVPVAALLPDYETFQWLDLPLYVQPTPGHTPGSITLLADIDGKRVAFSGDLLHSEGKLQTLYDLQYSYGEHEGVDLSIYSLTELSKRKPQLLCPSHGQPIDDPIAGIEQLSSKLRDWHRFWYKHPPTSDLEPVSISPHLVACTETTSSFYAIISDSGKALFVDYGCASWTFFQVFTRYVDTFGRMRFVEHSIEKLRANHGLRSIDVAIPSHMHDDHINGFPYLVQRHGTKIWVHECMKDILQNPRDLNVGCIFGEPLKVDRVLRDKETFRWEEFEFTVVHSPGHTNYEMAMFGVIDGRRVAFSGDAFFNDVENPKSLRHNLIYRNQVKVGDYLKSVQNLIDFKPDLIAPGHGEPFNVTRENASNFQERARRQDQLFQNLIADPDTDLGLHPSWLRIVPYQIRAFTGQHTHVSIQLTNHRTRAVQVDAVLVLPAGWISSPARISLQAEARSSSSLIVTIKVPAVWHAPSASAAMSRVAIAVDVVADGKYLGQIAEAVVDVERHT